MEYVAQVARDCFVRDEPVVLHLTFVNDGQARDFPYEPNVGDLLNLQVFDADGELLREANGYTWEQRLGNEVSILDPARLLTARLQPEGRVEWSEDLLSYIGVLGPGQYRVRVGFRFAPAGIDVRSDEVDFRVAAGNLVHVDLVADEVAVPVLHSIALHRRREPPYRDDETSGVVHFRLAADPSVHWEGQVFPGDPSAKWTAAVTDFVSSDSFEHDYSRWWAAVVGHELQVVKMASADEPISATLATALEHARLFARPIQHGDGGCSVVLWSRSCQTGVTLHRVGFGSGGQIAQSLQVVGDCNCGAPLASGLDRDGTIVVVTAGEDRLADALVRVSDTASTVEPLNLTQTLPDPIREFSQLLSVRLDTRRRRPEGDRLMLTGTIDTRHSLCVWAAWRDIHAASEPWHHVSVACDQLPFSGADPIAWADAILDGDRRPYLLVRASTGSCALWSQQAPSRLVTDDVPHLAGMPQLVDCGGHLHVADARATTGLVFESVR